MMPTTVLSTRIWVKMWRALAPMARRCITAAGNTNAHWGGIVYARRTGPEADAAQAVLTATRRAANSAPLIPNLREVIARSTGDMGWRNIRPPHLALPAAQADAVWTTWQATGAIPLPGLGLKVAAE